MRARQQLVILCCCLAAGNVPADEAEHRSRLESLKEQIAGLKETLFERTSEIGQLEERLEEREVAAGELRAKSRELETGISELESELEKMEKRRDDLEQHRKDQQAMIARELNAAYRLGDSEPVKVLLNQEDPHKLARILKYYQYFVAAREEKIHQFRKTIAELDALKMEIGGKQDNLLKAKEENAIKLAELALEMEKRQQVINELNKALEDDQVRLDRLNEERQRLEELIARLEEEFNNLAPPAAEPFAELRGRLPWPIEGRVSKAFGNERAQGLKWSGWLIDTKAGEPIRAIHNGRVVFSDYFRGHGLMVIVDHGDGFLSLYAHNDLLLKEEGDWVESGDPIARAGTTGGLSESALYFEIRHNGKPQDPKRWLGSRG